MNPNNVRVEACLLTDRPLIPIEDSHLGGFAASFRLEVSVDLSRVSLSEGVVVEGRTLVPGVAPDLGFPCNGRAGDQSGGMRVQPSLFHTKLSCKRGCIRPLGLCRGV